MSVVTVLRCETCRREADTLDAMRAMLAVLAPRESVDGNWLPEEHVPFCNLPCLQASLRPRQTWEEPCRWWCSSRSQSTPGCSCIDDTPGTSYDPWDVL